MFDSREYEWADITLIFAGFDLTGIRAIKYKEKIEQEHRYAKGRKPHGISRGNIGYEGELVLLQSDYIRMRQAGNGSVLGLRANAECSFGNPSTGDALTTNRLVGMAFGEAEEGMKQGDKFMEVTLPFLFTDLQPDV